MLIVSSNVIMFISKYAKKNFQTRRRETSFDVIDRIFVSTKRKMIFIYHGIMTTIYMYNALLLKRTFAF